jgi:DNA-binding NarL/FixJ family response regulator
MPIRVLIADDHAILREGLSSLLRKDSEFQVVGEAQDGEEALELMRKLRPDVAVLDISMPKLNGIEVCRKIQAELPSIRVVALSLHQESHILLGILKAGALGYVVKNSAFQELSTAIRAVAAGQNYVSPALSGQLIGEALKPQLGSVMGLSERELKIVKWLSEGWTSKQMSAELGVSIKTVDTQRRQIMDRLKIDSIAELTKYALREGLTTLNVTPPENSK